VLHIAAATRAVVLHTAAAARSFSKTNRETGGRLDSSEARVTFEVGRDDSWAAGPFSWADHILAAAKLRFF
jgi:hypothetical protein